MRYVIASSRAWNKKIPVSLSKTTGKEFIYIDRKEDLSYERLKDIQPRYIFFPHWSYIIPKDIHENFECVIFHMTDVPFGRGGSPLQNLLSRGIYETKMSALRCTSELDAGPVYMKEPLSLHGTAEEIYLRASKIVEDMIVEMVNTEPPAVEQIGEVFTFSRRKPEDGDISHLTELEQVFDYIRMLDADGYPNAFLETEHFRFEFKRPSLKFGEIISDVTITRKEKNE
ncbi:MAG: methionyl-tRNA formyltransferase [Candidatus Anammoxibacter sp.]